MAKLMRGVSILATAMIVLPIATPAKADTPPTPPGLTKNVPCQPVLSCAQDLGPALDLETKIADNTWDGQVYPIDYDPNATVRSRDTISSVSHFGDSALWTGTYLAAESFRYALAKKHLAAPKIKKDEREFWESQRSVASSRAHDMVAKYHILINISKYWKHEFHPRADGTYVGFGGGVFNGALPDEPGYLMRACI